MAVNRRPRNRSGWDFVVEGAIPPPKRKKPVQRELQHQRALYAWARTQPWEKQFFHWGNERWSQSEAHHLAATGVKRGPWDNWLFLPVGEWSLAACELKAPKEGGKRAGILTPAQKDFEEMLMDCRVATCVAYGWDEAREFFVDYVAGRV